MKLLSFDWFTKRGAENPSVPLSSPQAWATLFGDTGTTAAGVDVTVDRALGVPSIWAAVNLIAATIASLPLHVYRRTGKGRERESNTPLQRILHDAVHPEWTSYEWRRYHFQNVLTHGRGFTLILRDRSRRVAQLLPLDPARVTVEVREGVKQYVYTDDGGKRTYAADRVIDTPFLLRSDQISHRSPILTNRNAIGLAIALEAYASGFFEKGGVPPLSLEGPVNMSPEAAERAAKAIMDGIKRARAEGRNVLMMPLGHSLKPIGFDPEKGQLESIRRLQVEEAARIYNIPPTFLQDLTHGTFSNTEQQDLHFVKHTLRPWLTRFEQEMNLKLFGWMKTDRFVELNVEGLLRGDFKTRMEGYAVQIQNGIKTPNEIRKLNNDAPMDNADDLLIQGATVPLGSQPTNNEADDGNPSS